MARDIKILNYRWVYIYKFNKHGYYKKCKARLVVRGDQQKRISNVNIYAVTLVERNFKALIIIITRFNLEMI